MTEHSNPPEEEHDQGDSFEILIERARSNDQEALEQLVHRYRNYLLLLANNDMDQALRPKLGASDVVQQSMLAIHQNFPQFRGNSANEFKAWIRRILQNDLFNARRHYGGTQRRQMGREVQINDSKQVNPVLADTNKTPQSEALLAELAAEMERCLSQLSESHRQVLKMRNWQEKSFNEIGDELDLSADAARKLWFRAFNRLKQVILKTRPEFASHLIQISEAQTPPSDEG